MKTIKCPECRGSGIFENDPSGVFSLDCPVCDGDGEIEVPTTQADIDDLGIPASAADLTDWDGPDGEK
jgi:hypothetical protein